MAKKAVAKKAPAKKKPEVESNLVTLRYVWQEELFVGGLECETLHVEIVLPDVAVSLMEEYPERFEVEDGELPESE